MKRREMGVSVYVRRWATMVHTRFAPFPLPDSEPLGDAHGQFCASLFMHSNLLPGPPLIKQRIHENCIAVRWLVGVCGLCLSDSVCAFVFVTNDSRSRHSFYFFVFLPTHPRNSACLLCIPTVFPPSLSLGTARNWTLERTCRIERDFKSTLTSFFVIFGLSSLDDRSGVCPL